MEASGSAAQFRHTACVIAAMATFSILPFGSAWTQEVSSASDPLAPVLHVLPANTEVHLRMLESVSSLTHRRGDRFKLEVADVIELDGDVVIPAGTPAEGEVIHAAKATVSGRAGELILVVRFLNADGQQVLLRSFSAGTGEDRVDLAAGLGLLGGIPVLFVTGKNIVIPAGADIFAKVRANTSLRGVLGLVPVQDAPAAIAVEADTENTFQEATDTEIDNDENHK